MWSGTSLYRFWISVWVVQLMYCWGRKWEATRCAHRAEEDGIVSLYSIEPTLGYIPPMLFIVVTAPVEVVELQVECA